MKTVAARRFYRFVGYGLCVQRSLLTNALITSRVDYCNSILCHVAGVHLRPLQSVLNAAARLVVKKQKYDSITSTLRDDLHWLLAPERIDYKISSVVGGVA